MSAPCCWCIVPAAGRGTRFGGEVPKQYLMLAGKPLLLHTLERLARSSVVAGFVLALARDDLHWPGLAEIDGVPIRTAIGGDTRADSVLAGLRALTDVAADDFVLIHDAARPCVRGEDVARLVVLGMPAGGALVAAPVRDTLKRADAAGRVERTQPRDALWRALTPQMFRCGELAAALEAAARAGIAVTDEAMAMERMGFRPLLVEGAEDNLKVTTPADLALAQFLLAR